MDVSMDDATDEPTLPYLLRNGHVDELIAQFPPGGAADVFLTKAGIGELHGEALVHPQYWFRVCQLIAGGKVSGFTLSQLLGWAAAERPGNARFAPYQGCHTGAAPGAAAPPDAGRKVRKPRPLREVIRTKAAKVVSDRLSKAKVPQFLPVELEPEPPEGGPVDPVNEDGRGRPGNDAGAGSVLLVTEVQRWLAADGPAVAILTAPQGGGKTTGSCLLQQALEPILKDDTVVWVPADAGLFATDPDEVIRRALGFGNPVDLWHERAGVRCIILDGFDEGFTWLNRAAFVTWINALLRKMGDDKAGPRLLICGRDVMLEQGMIDPDLWEELGTTCELRNPAHPTPKYLRLRAWTDADLRRRLQGHLAAELNDADRAVRLMNLIGPGVLSSPLLYTLAYQVLWALRTQDGAGAGAPQFPTRWELTAKWVSDMIAHNKKRHPGPSGRSQRRRAAQEVALMLVASGQGVAGETVEKVRETAGAHLSRHPDRPDESLDLEVKTGLLLRAVARDHRLTPFHAAILTHLAAEALLLRLRGDDPGPGDPPPPGPPQDRGPGPSSGGTADLIAVAYEAAHAYVDHLGVQPGSLFEETLGYLCRHELRARMIPPLDLHQFAARLAEREVSTAVSVRVLARDVLVRGDAEAIQSLKRAEDARVEELFAAAGGRPQHVLGLLPIPPGVYTTWRLETKAGPRAPAAVELAHTVFLAENLCTVGEYAGYLTARPAAPLPHQPEAGWRRDGGRVVFDPEHAPLPVVGVTQEDARGYCEWLTATAPPPVAGAAGEYRLPRPDWLRVAAWGPELREATPARGGPFGHQRLVGRYWQLTEDADSHLLFGGGYGDDPKPLLPVSPDLCFPADLLKGLKKEDIGFRVSFAPRVLRRLHAEGPDGVRFELNDIPPDTPARAVAEAVLGEYGNAWPRDEGGQPRPGAVEWLTADGPVPLNPDTTLAAAGVVTGARLRVRPTRAGD